MKDVLVEIPPKSAVRFGFSEKATAAAAAVKLEPAVKTAVVLRTDAGAGASGDAMGDLSTGVLGF